MMKEVFRPIPGYEGKYEISNLKRVKSLSRPVKRSDGIVRNIRERFIYADSDSICLGIGRTGGKRHEPLKLMVSAFHRKYNPKKHRIICRGEKNKAILSDIMIQPRLEYNKLMVRDNEGNYTRYKNIMEFCDKNNVLNYQSFLTTLFRGWTKYNYYTRFDGWVLTFKHPVTYNHETKIIFTLMDTRSKVCKNTYESRKVYQKKYRSKHDTTRISA